MHPISGLAPRRASALLTLALLAGLLAPVAATAHAIVMESVPVPGAELAGPAVDFMLRFNSRIDAARSEFVLLRPDGTSEPLALLPQDGEDRLAARAEGLAPGAYRLHWQVLSVDGHITRGDLPFAVKAP